MQRIQLQFQTELSSLSICHGQNSGWQCEIASRSVYRQCLFTLYIQEACIHPGETDTIIGRADEETAGSVGSTHLLYSSCTSFLIVSNNEIPAPEGLSVCILKGAGIFRVVK